MLKDLLNNRTIKNAGWLIGGRIVQMLINLIVGLLTARYLGPSNFGVINYAGAYVSLFMTFCVLGINAVLVKEFVDFPQQDGKIIGTALGLRAVSSILSSIAIIAIAFVVDSGDRITITVVALSSIGLFFNIFETFNFWFQSRLESRITAIVTLMAYIITALYKTYLIVTQKSVEYFALATSIDYICLGIGLWFAYKKQNGGKLVFSWDYAKSLLKKSAPFILPGLMVAIYGQTDKVMLKQLISTSETAYYSTAVAVCNVWSFILVAIIDSIYPSIMKANNTDEKVFIRRNKLLYAIVFYFSIVVSLTIMIFSKPIILLLYGEAYSPSIAPLRIVTWYTAFSYLGVARNAWIVCKNKQKYLIYIYSAAAVSNVVLNFVLIPSFGAVGAAIASLLAQIITVMVVPFFIKPLRENSIMMIEAICFKGILGER